MKNIAIIIGIVVVLGLGVYKLTQKNTQNSLEMAETPKQMVTEKVDSRYLEYSNSTLENSVNNRRVLFFYASWCSTCRPADANFKENINKIPENVSLIRVNYNDSDTDLEEKDLAKKYGISYQHTFVQIDSEGNEITKWNGGQIDELLSNIK